MLNSAATSVNHIPAGFKKIVKDRYKGINLDWGGGKYDKGTKYLNQWGIINLVYDPYNRSEEHNQEMLAFATAAGGARLCHAFECAVCDTKTRRSD